MTCCGARMCGRRRCGRSRDRPKYRSCSAGRWRWSSCVGGGGLSGRRRWSSCGGEGCPAEGVHGHAFAQRRVARNGALPRIRIGHRVWRALDEAVDAAPTIVVRGVARPHPRRRRKPRDRAPQRLRLVMLVARAKEDPHQVRAVGSTFPVGARVSRRARCLCRRSLGEKGTKRAESESPRAEHLPSEC